MQENTIKSKIIIRLVKPYVKLIVAWLVLYRLTIQISIIKMSKTNLRCLYLL